MASVSHISSHEYFFSIKAFLRNIGWNLLGFLLPAIAGIYAVPVLVKALGYERFGLLSLFWVGVGYLSLFDFGVSRALTKMVSENIATGRANENGRLITSGLWLLLVFGLCAGFVGLGGGWLATRTSRLIAGDILDEAALAWIVIMATLPLVTITSGLIGVLQAYHRFAAVNVIKSALGISNFLLPIFCLQIKNSLVLVAISLLVSRVLVFLAFYAVSHGLFEVTRWRFEGNKMRAMLNYGGWITLSNVISPLMTYLDRFVVSTSCGLQAVAFYTTPFDAAQRLATLPEAIIGAVFPMLTKTGDKPAVLARLYGLSSILLDLTTFAPILALILYSRAILTIWISADFADHSDLILKIILFGMYVNCHARLPLTILHAAGRPKLPALAHLVELPVYVALLWWFIKEHGVLGAAMAWSIRVALDSLALQIFAIVTMPDTRRAVARCSVVTLAGAGLILLSLWAGTNSQMLLMLLAGTVYSVFLLGALLQMKRSSAAKTVGASSG